MAPGVAKKAGRAPCPLGRKKGRKLSSDSLDKLMEGFVSGKLVGLENISDSEGIERVPFEL
eukprot:2802302-Lingulodinium_polyedra.AAC.1